MMRFRKGAAIALALALSIQTAIPVFAADVRIPDGTKIGVRLMEQLSSATVKDGDPVNFTVVEDVLVNGQVAIKQGTPVKGLVVEAAAKKRMGRAGKLAYSVTETKAVDLNVVRLRAIQDKKGDSHVTSTAVTTTAVAVFVPVAAPFFLLRKGKDIVIPEGTRVDAFVDGDHVVSIGDTSDAVTRPSNARVTLENADIVALHEAGFGDEVILAKISASTAGFSVNAADLVLLKKAGISDRVIAAMVSAK